MTSSAVLRLTPHRSEIIVDGTDVDLIVPRGTREALLALGWTPPAATDAT